MTRGESDSWAALGRAARQIRASWTTAGILPAIGGDRRLLEACLAQQLYSTFYSGFAYAPCGASGDAYEYLSRLSAANTTRAGTDLGWEVIPISSPQLGVSVTKRGEVRVLPGNVSPASLPVVREDVRQQPGFYFAFGEAQAGEALRLRRIYLNLSPEAGPLLIRTLTGWLNRFTVPFQLKCAAHPGLFGRVDPVVLFFDGRFDDIVARLLPRVVSMVKQYLRNGSPAFTRPLTTGVALADDPGNGQSFGGHRCALIAEAIVRAWTSGRYSEADLIAASARRFEESGIALAAPHLNPGLADSFPDLTLEE